MTCKCYTCAISIIADKIISIVDPKEVDTLLKDLAYGENSQLVLTLIKRLQKDNKNEI